MAGDILAEIKRLAGLGRIRLTFHAEKVRMPERGATFADVRQALLTASEARWQTDRENWRVAGGVDTDGDELTIIVDVEADVIVVTLF